MIQDFENWLNESQELSREEEAKQLDTQVDKIKAWLNSVGFEENEERKQWQYEVSYFRPLNHVSIYIMTPFNQWVYKYDEKKVKYNDPYSRMVGHQHYKGTGKNTWFVVFPGGSTRYNHQANTKQMSFNSFKGVFSKVLEIEKSFKKMLDFVLYLAPDKKEEEQKKRTEWIIRSLTDISCDFRLPEGNIYYNWKGKEDEWQVRYREGDKEKINAVWKRDTLDTEKFTTTGLMYSSMFKCIEFGSDISGFLETLNEEPIDSAWEKIQHKLRGKIQGNQFGL